MDRRTFSKKTLYAATFVALSPYLPRYKKQKAEVRLGAPLFGKLDDPDSWVTALKKQNFRAAYCPVQPGAASETIKAYENAARKADIVIAEVGAWSNPLSDDAKTAGEAFKKCVDALVLAEAIGANCCVNISGSKNPTKWAGPHKENLTQATFDQVVEITRKIIDEVKPTRTYFTLEFMPWSYPDSVDAYLRIIKAVNRKQFAVHLDPMNIIESPRDFFGNGAIIKDCFKRLGPLIRSCHGKDIFLKDDVYTPQLVECRPGLGQLDYRTYLTELSKLKNIPLMLEHLPNAEEYEKAAVYVRSVGKEVGVTL